MQQYDTIKTRLENGVLTATIDNPPINLMNRALYVDLLKFTQDVEQDDEVRVLILESADPDFFIAHFDVTLILATPIDTPAERSDKLNDFHLMCERLRTMPKPTIAKIAGRVGGGGNELCASCDMRFGLIDKTVINQMEVPLGILPGGTGTQRLPNLVGRGRALEIILGADDLDAKTAADWGYLNRVFQTQSELDNFVTKLAHRMASWPVGAIRLAKQSVLNAEPSPKDGMLEEAYLFAQTLRQASAQTNMRAALELGAQTREGELDIAELCLEVARTIKQKDRSSEV